MENSATESGNLPANRQRGRPPGTRNKRKLWVEEMLRADATSVKAFVATIKRLAMGGDADFASGSTA
jgi:hypothetical protein